MPVRQDIAPLCVHYETGSLAGHGQISVEGTRLAEVY